jgi:hypothetical protein
MVESPFSRLPEDAGDNPINVSDVLGKVDCHFTFLKASDIFILRAWIFSPHFVYLSF